MAVGSGLTTRGYHYLQPGDAPDLAGITQQLAQDLNTDVASLAAAIATLSADTGWTSMTSGGGTGSTAKWRRIGSVVEVVANITGASIASNSSGTIIVTAANGLPAASRPIDTIYGAASLGGSTSGLAVLNTDGSLGALNNSGATVSVFRCAFAFFVG